MKGKFTLKQFEKENKALRDLFYRVHKAENELEEYKDLVNLIRDASAPSMKGTVLEMIHRNILQFDRKKKRSQK